MANLFSFLLPKQEDEYTPAIGEDNKQLIKIQPNYYGSYSFEAPKKEEEKKEDGDSPWTTMGKTIVSLVGPGGAFDAAAWDTNSNIGRIINRSRDAAYQNAELQAKQEALELQRLNLLSKMGKESTSELGRSLEYIKRNYGDTAASNFLEAQIMKGRGTGYKTTAFQDKVDFINANYSGDERKELLKSALGYSKPTTTNTEFDRKVALANQLNSMPEGESKEALKSLLGLKQQVVKSDIPRTEFAKHYSDGVNLLGMSSEGAIEYANRKVAEKAATSLSGEKDLRTTKQKDYEYLVNTLNKSPEEAYNSAFGSKGDLSQVARVEEAKKLAANDVKALSKIEEDLQETLNQSALYRGDIDYLIKEGVNNLPSTGLDKASGLINALAKYSGVDPKGANASDILSSVENMVKAKFRLAVAGAGAVSNAEQNMISACVPKSGDTKEVILRKLKNLQALDKHASIKLKKKMEMQESGKYTSREIINALNKMDIEFAERFNPKKK